MFFYIYFIALSDSNYFIEWIELIEVADYYDD